MKLEIGDIKLRRVFRSGKVLAEVSIVMDDSIAIHEIKLVQIDGRMLLSMPNRRCADGVYRDIVHPISIEAREILQEAIVKAYKDWVAKQ